MVLTMLATSTNYTNYNNILAHAKIILYERSIKY